LSAPYLARLPCAATVCLLGMGIPTMSGPLFSSSIAHEKVPSRTLTFAERAADQRAIEEVYWRHRIWPKENAQPKPPFGAIVSQEQLEEKVEDYLRKSQFVAERRGWPIAANELQAEIERMASNSKQPDVLRELFEALGNDRFVIAECLARPALAERFSAYLTVPDMPSAARNLSAADTAASIDNRLRAQNNIGNAAYKLPEISAPQDCSDDTWTA